MTVMDRHTSCILVWRVVWECSAAHLQAMVDEAPQAKFDHGDLFATYRNPVYTPGHHTPMPYQSETYRVEGDNAELRHYLARLARRLRCFPRRIDALRCAIELFVDAWSCRQLFYQRFPKYTAFVSPAS